MGVRNYLIEGGSCTGKTSVCDELRRRGFHTIHGDRELAYQGDPETGHPVENNTGGSRVRDSRFVHRHHVWDLQKVRTLVADHSRPVSFFCGSSRNAHRFVDLFDRVFILEIDAGTLKRRLDARVDEWGADPDQRDLIERLHQTGEDRQEAGTPINATAPISDVVDDILSMCDGGESA